MKIVNMRRFLIGMSTLSVLSIPIAYYGIKLYFAILLKVIEATVFTN